VTSFWLSLALGAWLIGWLLDVRPALRRRMLAQLAVECDLPNCPDRDRSRLHPEFCRPVLRVRGAIRERNGTDALMAILCAAWWPVRLTVILLAGLLEAAGRGVGAVVLSAPLTAPELERRLHEQQAEIARLTAQIDEGGRRD
jgi:hypothetical protein